MNRPEPVRPQWLVNLVTRAVISIAITMQLLAWIMLLLPMLGEQVYKTSQQDYSSDHAVYIGFPLRVGIFNLYGIPPGMRRVAHCPEGEVCDRIDLGALAADVGFWYLSSLAVLYLDARFHFIPEQFKASLRRGWPPPPQRPVPQRSLYERIFFPWLAAGRRATPQPDFTPTVDSPANAVLVSETFRFLVDLHGLRYTGFRRGHYDFLSETAHIRIEHEGGKPHISVHRAGEPEFTRLTLLAVLQYFEQGAALENIDYAPGRLADNMQRVAAVLRPHVPRIIGEIDIWWLPAQKFHYQLALDYYHKRRQLDFFWTAYWQERGYLKSKGMIE